VEASVATNHSAVPIIRFAVPPARLAVGAKSARTCCLITITAGIALRPAILRSQCASKDNVFATRLLVTPNVTGAVATAPGKTAPLVTPTRMSVAPAVAASSRCAPLAHHYSLQRFGSEVIELARLGFTRPARVSSSPISPNVYHLINRDVSFHCLYLLSRQEYGGIGGRRKKVRPP
jgi:hypothetical protein